MMFAKITDESSPQYDALAPKIRIVRHMGPTRWIQCPHDVLIQKRPDGLQDISRSVWKQPTAKRTTRGVSRVRVLRILEAYVTFQPACESAHASR